MESPKWAYAQIEISKNAPDSIGAFLVKVSDRHKYSCAQSGRISDVISANAEPIIAVKKKQKSSISIAAVH